MFQYGSEEEEDAHNEETFGEVAGDYSFGLPFDSAITIVRRKPTVDEEEGPPPGMSPPGLPSPGMSPPGLSSPRRPLTLTEIEAGLQGIDIDGPKLFRGKSKGAMITFEDPTSSPHRDTMTRFEREGISRIHLGQLTTENPDLEDFYYRSYAKRQAKRKSEAPLLYLPLPSQRKQKGGERDREQKQLKTKEALAGALGKAVSSSSRKPRQQLQVPSSTKMVFVLYGFNLI